jgi:hypothetical protein
MPTHGHLVDKLTDARPVGAFGKALVLPLLTRPRVDLLDPQIELSYPSEDAVDLHHVYPRDWCKNNKHGRLASVLDPQQAGRNYTDSVSNLIALSR